MAKAIHRWGRAVGHDTVVIHQDLLLLFRNNDKYCVASAPVCTWQLPHTIAMANKRYHSTTS